MKTRLLLFLFAALPLRAGEVVSGAGRMGL